MLSEAMAWQWGMVTAAQAERLGLSRSDLADFVAGGHLVQVLDDVYMGASVPTSEFDELRATWLSTDPATFADDRPNSGNGSVVVAGESAAALHRIGDYWASTHEFVSPENRESQHSRIRFRARNLEPNDVTLVEGLPVMTLERTIADLVEGFGDLRHVANALRDASGKRPIDENRLVTLLEPLAQLDNYPHQDGQALLETLKFWAGIDAKSVARRIADDSILAPLLFDLIVDSKREESVSYARS